MTPYKLMKRAETRDKRLKKIAHDAFMEMLEEDVKRYRLRKKILTGVIICGIVIVVGLIIYFS